MTSQEHALGGRGLPLRAKVASSVSKTAAALSRAAGRGDGSVIGGWIGLKIDPDLLRHLAAGRRVALVSGTNGKTTTTRLTAAAMGVLGEVATNSLGANMPTGHTSALARAGHTPYAVLEVDEHYLGQVIDATAPAAIALLNLSRDQLDRAKEVAMMASLWRDAVRDQDSHVVANADDPMVVWAARVRPARDLGRLRAALARRLLGLPRVRVAHRARRPGRGERRLALHRLRPAPSRSTMDRRWGRRGRPGRGAPPGHAATAGAGEPRERGHGARGRGPVRGRPGSGGPPAAPGRVDRRPVRHRREGRPHHPSAAGQEPGRMAGGVRHGRAGADPALDQRPRPGRPGHVLALRRGLLARCTGAGS